MELISRAAAMEAFMGKPPEYYHTSYIVGELNCVPAVDAVPVEWLRDKMRGYASSLKSTETAALVMVMQMWQKEQEAR